jgi:hypothetical protein
MALTRIQPSALDQTLNYTANTFTANYITFGDGTTQTTAGGGGSGTDAFARTQANSANLTAVSAFNQANSANLTAVTAFNQANVSIIIGQASYGQANVATIIAQAAYVQANSEPIGTAAYVQANTATTIAQAAYTQANSEPIGTAAFNKANSASTLAQGAYDRANTKLSLEGGTIAGSLVIQNNLTVQGNVSYTGNVTSISVTGNTGQFFGYASNGFNALYAGIPTGYFLEPQIGFQVSSNYDGYAGINMQNINTGANASSDLFITADNGTVNDGFIDLGIGSSTYNYTGYSLIGKNDGYLFATGNTTTGGGNMIVGTGLNNDIVFSVGGINTSNEIGRFKYNTGLVLKQFPIKFADNTSQNTAAAPFAFSNSAFDRANTANTLAQGAFDKANTDFTNISITSGTYGNTTYVPVITVSANGRVTNIVNTAITFSLAKNTQAFTSGTAATYTAPANTQWVKVTVVGPGGNGGNATTSRATGGSGGGVAIKWLAMTAGQTLTYTVSTASGAASTVSSGTLTISTITANSGSNGTTTAYANSSTAGPAGGTATGGDVNITGGSGGNSYGSAATVATNHSGKGGDCPGFGSGGGSYGSTAAAGQNGVGYGAGGGGSHGVSSTPLGAGGIIIFEAF